VKIKNITLVFIPFILTSCNQTRNVLIMSVHDGDTFSDSKHHYRLMGVDTPEISSLKSGV
jgi:endonuclease YncB( thermonuclease family)